MESKRYQEWLGKFDKLPESTQQVIAESLLGRSLELYIDPTEKCNFRCVYCYESFLHGRMKPEVIERVKLFILRRSAGIGRLYINWFGGEPLTALPVVEDISAWANNQCERSNIELIGGMTTNGYNLNRALLDKLVGLNIRNYQISLDGDASYHDQVRRRADGAGTFNTIWTNLNEAAATNLRFRIIIRVHLRKSNFDSVSQLLEKIDNSFGKDDRFIVGLHPLEDLGGEGVKSVDVLDHKTFDIWSEQLKNRPSARSAVKNMREEMIPMPGQEACGFSVCYACKNNAFHIRSDGRIGKCTVALDKDYNVVGRLADDGTLILDQKKSSKWTAGLLTLNRQDLSCPLSKGDGYFKA
ncbi:radical SAM protein [Oleiagrimonas sp. C23AA]|uniref:radical SAM protein n=1 Tax=Oleiagrimonas sp. C23AA TaxID=2719047 RepID=UPI0014235AFE|nr:radical SAM protein [Oleiagrimonas sp. C23AA]NII11002.1 radical SAM protein [Oleiagrimonas sp. C23AA]